MNKFTAALFIQSLFLFLLIGSIESYKVVVTIEPAGANYTEAKFLYNGIETFDSSTTGVFQTDFGTNSVLSGAYSNGGKIHDADSLGGANGKGKYLRANGNSDLLITNQRNSGVNYFGLLMTSVGWKDRIQFFTDSSNEGMIFNWNPYSLIEHLNSGNSAKYTNYMHNPWFPDSKVLSVFVNFYFYDVKIHKVKIGDHVYSDNHVVGWFNGQSGEVVQEHQGTLSPSLPSPTLSPASPSSPLSPSPTSPLSSSSSTSTSTSSSPSPSYRVRVTVEPAKANNTQTQFLYHGIETFDLRTSGAFQTDFGTNSVLSGVYSNGGKIHDADSLGGANGKGKYIRANGNSDLLITNQRNSGVNYFGFLISSLATTDKIGFFADSSNEVKIFEFDGNSIYNFLLIHGYSDYYGNPWLSSPHSAYPHIFVNFYFYDVAIHKVKFGNNVYSDNHVVGWFNATSGETVGVYQFSL